MATVKRFPYHRRRGGEVAIRGEVNTAGAGDGRPAVLILLGAERREGASGRLLERLARAGLAAISAEIVPDWTVEKLEAAADAISEFAADLLAGRHPDLAPPKALGKFGEKREAVLAIAVAAREPHLACLVTWDLEVPEPLRESRMGALSAKVKARWLDIRPGKKSAQPLKGSKGSAASEVRYLTSEAEMMDAAVAWFAAMLS